MAELPLVSICLPTYNGSRWIRQALESGLQQDYPNIEIVVVDDASSDDTPAIVREYARDGVRLHANPVNRGHNANWNLSLLHARGSLIKFLHQDDFLQTSCVSQMVSLAEGAPPSIGMVFCRREVIADEAMNSDSFRVWLEHNGQPDLAFGSLEQINRGADLFGRWADAGLRSNWVGEPCCVMVRRSALAMLGTFHLRMRQTIDMDLWARVAAHFDVGFLPDRLATYRVRPGSLTDVNQATREHILDRLWMLEGLTTHERIAADWPIVGRWLRGARREFIQLAGRRVTGRPGASLKAIRSYTRFRASKALGRAPQLYGSLDQR